MTLVEAENLANDPIRVARHNFYPFLSYKVRWTRFAKRGAKGDVKDRPISYACRADSVIFTRYRSLISALYERKLVAEGLAGNVIAYRKIKDSISKQGKSNIHFARDAFQIIKEHGNCHVITMDIKSYFNSIDHLRLKLLWCRLLVVDRLPDDHFAVFQAITKHSCVDKIQAYERLGYYGVRAIDERGSKICGYLVPRKQIPMRLCDGKTFRAKIAGKSDLSKIIDVNSETYGIPQGSPISDVLANLNLLDFDKEISAKVGELGGTYLRYCDDILVITPGTERDTRDLIDWIDATLPLHGIMLKSKVDKTTLHRFYQVGGSQFCSHLLGKNGKVGLEYLGFRYNGKYVYLKDGSLANYQRKMIRSAYRLARKHVENNSKLKLTEIVETFDIERYRKKFGRVENFALHAHDIRTWTFRSYVKKAAEVFGKDGHRMIRQLRRFNEVTKANIEVAIRHEFDSAQKRTRRLAARSKKKAYSQTQNIIETATKE